MIDKFINREETSANFDLYLVSFYLDHDALRTKFINTLRLSHEHDLELLAIRIVVDILSQFFINSISFGRDVDSDSSFEVDNVGF